MVQKPVNRKEGKGKREHLTDKLWIIIALDFPSHPRQPPGLWWMKCQMKQALLIFLLNPAFNNKHPGRGTDNICLMKCNSQLPSRTQTCSQDFIVGSGLTSLQTLQLPIPCIPSHGGDGGGEGEPESAKRPLCPKKFCHGFFIILCLLHSCCICTDHQGGMKGQVDAPQTQLLRSDAASGPETSVRVCISCPSCLWPTVSYVDLGRMHRPKRRSE